MNSLKLKSLIYSLMYSLFIRNFLNIVKGKVYGNFNKYPYNIKYPTGNCFRKEKVVYKEKDYSTSLKEEDLNLALPTYKEDHLTLYSLAERVMNWMHLTKKKKKP